jgi:hypothetical protein
VIGFGVIGPCLAREAIPQLAGLTELVLGDQGMSSVARVRRVPRRRGTHTRVVLRRGGSATAMRLSTGAPSVARPAAREPIGF